MQRRHQKVVEIAPGEHLDDRVRHEPCEASARIAKEIGYDNAGTIEFLYDLDTKEWFFIEMNPRIQVEHTVTEQITGIDPGALAGYDRAGSGTASAGNWRCSAQDAVHARMEASRCSAA